VNIIDHLSLLHGVVPWAVPGLSGAGLATAIVRRRRRWWTVTLPLLAALSAALVVVLAWYLDVSGTVRDHYPPTFMVWVGSVVLATLVAVVGWGSAGIGRRLLAVAAVPLTGASAFLLINSHYAYWPTVGDVLGRPLPNQINRQALAGYLAGTGSAPSGTPLVPPVASPGRKAASTGWTAGRDPRRRSRSAELAAAPSPAMHGVLVPIDVPPGTSGFRSRPGTLYLPPAFFASPPPPLPVIVLLGGTPGGPDAWPRSGVLDTVNAYAGQHGGVAPILAFVDHNGSFTRDTECVDGPVGAAETFLAVDVPRYLSGLLHVPLNRDQWAIGGFSEGGTCAFQLAVRHPDVYRTFVDIAGDWAPNLGSAGNTLEHLYGGDRGAMAAHDPTTLLRSQRFEAEDGWFVVGGADSAHLNVAQRLTPAARAAGITTVTEILPGDHTWRFVVSAFRVVFPEIASRLDGLVTPPATASGSA